jgi:hypothetical protein|tara:strand:- start:1146 stop:1379 length:234 start_codon:yes stop_codon:yes gene_type:complete
MQVDVQHVALLEAGGTQRMRCAEDAALELTEAKRPPTRQAGERNLVRGSLGPATTSLEEAEDVNVVAERNVSAARRE